MQHFMKVQRFEHGEDALFFPTPGNFDLPAECIALCQCTRQLILRSF